MSDDTMPAVSHDAAAKQFEIRTASGTAHLRYVPSGTALDLVHTEVPPEHEGQGYGSALVEAAFAHARKEKLQVIPTCPFVRHYVDAHPALSSLIAR
ncbi:MAG: GCN5-related N-acetyltransferase [Gemmatimonadetes bacterium]|jgi:predicted GNAT family acetyltransferase|nr:GCN5-related N-acetyltransferase [Gemmatimonadota bacterium]